MCTRPICPIIVFAVLSSVAGAATVHWTAAGADRLWDNPQNWEGNKVPGISDEVYIDVPAALPPNGPIIQDGTHAKVLGLACEVAGEPSMTMTGGTLEVADWIWWGDGAGCHGTFHMSGGLITVVNEHELGWQDGTGTWIMTGGEVHAGRLIIPTATGRAGQLYLHGGTYYVGSGGLTMTAVGLIDITEGTLILEGDQQATLKGLMSAKQITAYDGDGYLDLDYDVRNPGMTTLTAVEITGKAYGPTPADGATGVVLQLVRWGAGKNAMLHDVYLGTSPDALEFMGRQPVTMYWHVAGLTPDTTYYWRVDEVEAGGAPIHTGDVWSFTTAPLTAYAPRPWDGAKWVGVDADLSWTAGMNARSHDLYLSTDKAAVEAGDASASKGNQAAATYDPGTLTPDTTYYWRVDERGDGGAVHPGTVWSFTTLGPGGGIKAQYFAGKELGGKPILTRTENSVDHQWGDGEVAGGLRDQVSARWTADLEAPLTETYTLITTSDDGVRLWLDGRLLIDNWTDHGTTDNRARVDLVAGQVYSLRMEWYESGGGAVAQLSWQSPSIPRQIIPAGPLQPSARATGPYPPHLAVNVPQTPILRWLPSETAARHDVYFGDDPDAVAGADLNAAEIYRGRQALDAATYDPGVLEWNKTYYWRVDEVNDADPQSPRKGSLWTFTTADFIVVDDFESYTDDEGTRIYETWIDGWTNDSGSRVGYLQAPFAEQTIVHGGRQSMPLDCNNVASPYYSETERTWATPQDWTMNGVDTLVIHVRGRAGNSAAPLYAALEDSAGKTATVSYSDNTATTSTQWIEWALPLSDFVGINAASIKGLRLGVGNPAASAPGGTGLIYLDDIRVQKRASLP